MKKKPSKQTDYKPLCNDCGVDVLRTGNWYMATPELWQKKFGLGWNDNLCIACLEKRLGRKAKAWKDIMPIIIGTDSERTTIAPKTLCPRLMELFHGQRTARWSRGCAR